MGEVFNFLEIDEAMRERRIKRIGHNFFCSSLSLSRLWIDKTNLMDKFVN